MNSTKTQPEGWKLTTYGCGILRSTKYKDGLLKLVKALLWEKLKILQFQREFPKL